MDASATNKTILIVEDDKSVATTMAEVLKREGYTVLNAYNGKEGLDMAMAKKPNLILLDIMMPVMDGMTMLKKLREDTAWGANVTVIILTNLNDTACVYEAVKQHVRSFLIKADWSLDNLLKEVKANIS